MFKEKNRNNTSIVSLFGNYQIFNMCYHWLNNHSLLLFCAVSFGGSFGLFCIYNGILFFNLTVSSIKRIRDLAVGFTCCKKCSNHWVNSSSCIQPNGWQAGEAPNINTEQLFRLRAYISHKWSPFCRCYSSYLFRANISDISDRATAISISFTL